MGLMKITEVTEKFEISSRTLRYYEQVGLLKSERPPFEKYRFYDSENISRLKQILVLRKMQIPIKDILRIYENQDMEILVQSFVKRIEEIDDEINTLFQLKTYINDFLYAMTAHGITQISALPLLYEKVEAELLSIEKPDLFIEKLSTLSDKLAKPLDMDIVALSPMLVVTSVRTDSEITDIEAFWDWISTNQIPFGKPGRQYGENYWFNGCAAYLMECLGQNEFDYSFFAGLTGENFTQVFSKNHFRGNGVVDYCLSEKDNHHFIETIFERCGYASTFVPLKQILRNREMYVQMLMSYIDKGLPVILNDYGSNPHNRFSWGVIVGYADYGKTLLYMGGDGTEPDYISVEDLLPKGYKEEGQHCHGWMFIGEKEDKKDLAAIYRERILSLPQLLTFENENYCFGAKAFCTWAKSIDEGLFEQIMPEDFDDWGMHTAYVCCLATNSSVSFEFLEKALTLNPVLIFIQDMIALYKQMGQYWNNDNGTDLEALGGGFNVTLDALQDRDRRKKIGDKLRKFAVCMDEVVSIIDRFKVEF